MERDQVSLLVIGLGFRNEAGARAIGEALAVATGKAGAMASIIAVPDDKAWHPALLAAAQAANLPIKSVSAEAIRASDPKVFTRSAASLQHRGVGSVCEAVALAGAGSGARLVVARVISTDRTATAAAAIVEDTAS
jgi:cobalt-precorrin 5A hydrolase